MAYIPGSEQRYHGFEQPGFWEALNGWSKDVHYQAAVADTAGHPQQPGVDGRTMRGSILTPWINFRNHYLQTVEQRQHFRKSILPAEALPAWWSRGED